MKNLFLSFIAFTFLSVNISAQDWEQKASYPGVPRHHPVTWGIGDYGYVLTGGDANNTPLKDFYQYDVANDTWAQLPDFPGTARMYSIGTAYNGVGFIGFGSTATSYLNDFWKYDTELEEWIQLASCPCLGRQHPAFIAHEGKIYAGLGNHNLNLKDWWEYDISANTWTQMPDLPGPQRHHPFHFSLGDFVYAGMGHGDPGITIYDDWYRFDPATNEWQMMNTFPGQGRVAGTQFSYGNHGYVLSGDGEDHSYMQTGEFWQYDAETDSWEALTSHPGQSRWAPNAFVVDDKVFFTSGVNKFLGMIYNDVWSFTLPEIEEPIDTTQPVAVFDLQEEVFSFQLFPNPGVDVLHVKSNFMGASTVSMEIFDYSGKLLLNGPFTNTIQIESFNSGIYLLRMTDEAGNHYYQRFQKL